MQEYKNEEWELKPASFLFLFLISCDFSPMVLQNKVIKFPYDSVIIFGWIVRIQINLQWEDKRIALKLNINLTAATILKPFPLWCSQTQTNFIWLIFFRLFARCVAYNILQKLLVKYSSDQQSARTFWPAHLNQPILWFLRQKKNSNRRTSNARSYTANRNHGNKRNMYYSIIPHLCFNVFPSNGNAHCRSLILLHCYLCIKATRGGKIEKWKSTQLTWSLEMR